MFHLSATPQKDFLYLVLDNATFKWLLHLGNIRPYLMWNVELKIFDNFRITQPMMSGVCPVFPNLHDTLNTLKQVGS